MTEKLNLLKNILSHKKIMQYLDDVQPSEFARWAGNALYAAAKKSGPPLAIAGAKKARDYFRPSFRDYAYSKNTTKRLTNSTMNTTKAGGQRPPQRVNAKNGSWVKYPRQTKADKELATRGWVKKTLQLDSIGKEVTANSATATAGSLVFFRLGKNIDKGNDQADRKGSIINMLGFRFFGSIRLDIPAPSAIRFRFILAQDKTPGRTITEAFFSSTADNRDPIDFPTGASFGTINAVRPINTDRWIVKADWVERLGAGSQDPLYGSSVVFNRYFKINKKFTYNADYLTVAEDLLPSMYMMMFPVTDDGTITTTLSTNYQFEEYFHN